MKDKWYVATLIIGSRVEGLDGPFICDEQIKVIRAPDEDTAYAKAVELGKEEEHDYKNSEGQTVYWYFAGIASLDELDGPIRDGTEIRSRLFDSNDPGSLVLPKEDLMVYLVRDEASKRLTEAS